MRSRWVWAAAVSAAAVWIAGSALAGPRNAASGPASRPASRPASAPALVVTVDERVELLCIIFRLAGHPEYNKAVYRPYAAAVDEHFRPFKDHAVVKLARRLRAERGVSYDAPMSVVPHVTDARTLAEAVPLDPLPEGVDSRWTPELLRQFLSDARDFARQSDFAGFVQRQRPLYDQVARQLGATLGREVDLAWFDRFTGQPAGATFHLVPALLNGPCCYAAARRGPGVPELYCVLGVWELDRAGQPTFTRVSFSTVIHEFAHSYANPLVDQFARELEPAGRALFAKYEATMRPMGYGHWKTVLYESLVRAMVVRYQADHGGVAVGLAQSLEERARGFVWVGDLAGRLASYSARRDRYRTLADFMPQVVVFFNGYVGSAASAGAVTTPGPTPPGPASNAPSAPPRAPGSGPRSTATP